MSMGGNYDERGFQQQKKSSGRCVHTSVSGTNLRVLRYQLKSELAVAGNTVGS